MLSVILVILILGYLPWNTLFGIKCFDKFNEWLLGIKIESLLFSLILFLVICMHLVTGLV